MNGQQDNQKHHSAEEIVRYLSGKMGREENHAFERSMVDDDLLADAVEGYQLMRESMSDHEIFERVREVTQQRNEKEEKQTPVVSFWKYKWLGYAVAACFVVATGWWLFGLTQKEQVLPNEGSNTILPDQSIALVDSMPSTPEKNPIADIASTKKEKIKTADEKVQIKKPEKIDPAPHDVAVLTEPTNRLMAEEVRASAETRTSPDTHEVKFRSKVAGYNVKINPSSIVLVTIVDTSDAIPSVGWAKYNEYASGELPKPTENNTGHAVMTIQPNGKVSNVEISGKLTNDEKALAEKVLMNGPDWKSKTGLKAQVILEWQ